MDSVSAANFGRQTSSVANFFIDGLLCRSLKAADDRFLRFAEVRIIFFCGDNKTPNKGVIRKRLNTRPPKPVPFGCPRSNGGCNV